jgi:tricorn protease-like protein
MRPVIQLIFTPVGNLLAVCADGTIWIGRGGLDAPEWEQLKGPPTERTSEGVANPN